MSNESLAAASSSAASSSSFSPPNPLLTVPLLMSGSPYPDALMAATKLVTKQVSLIATTIIDSSALLIVMRIQDRLAHYLLALHYYGADSEWSHENHLTYSASSTLVPIAGSMFDFRFPDRVAVENCEITKCALLERGRSCGRLAALSNHEQLTSFHDVGLVFERVLAQRWCDDFIRGLDLDLYQSSTPPLFSVADQVALATYLEYMTAEILDRAGYTEWSRKRHIISALDIWECMAMDPDLLPLRTFLPIEWHIDPVAVAALDSSLAASSPSVSIIPASLDSRNGTHSPIAGLLESQMKVQLDLLSTSSLPCWFANPAAVHSAAHAFAQGHLHESAVTSNLRALNCRPYRYWGEYTGANSFLREYIAFPNDTVADAASNYSHVSFLLTDGAGEEWHLAIELNRSTADSFPSAPQQGRLLLFDTLTPIGSFVWSDDIGATNELNSFNHRCLFRPYEQNYDWWRIISPLTHKLYSPHETSNCGLEVMRSSSEDATASSSSAPPVFASSMMLARTTFSPLTSSELKSASPPVRLTHHFQSLISNLLLIPDSTRCDPHLYLAHQPEAIRRSFTSHLIDESMIADGLTPLPTVLLSIVCDYYTFDLPYLDHEQVQKIQSSLPAPQRESNSDKQMYLLHQAI